MPKPLMIAHRGAAGLEAENTCAAFTASGMRSYFGIETDVHRTSDGRFILTHDDDAFRVTGEHMIIEETPFDTLRSLRLRALDGSFSRTDLIMPTLEEYIGICKTCQKHAILELKNHFEPADVARIIEVIRSMGHLEKTVFISFDLPNMITIRDMLPDHPAQFLIEKKVPDDLFLNLHRYHLGLDIDHRLLTEEIAAQCKAEGIPLNVWTVNTIENAQRVMAMGVDFITTNILE